jgi:sirohydrochlorin ferrochelatase
VPLPRRAAGRSGSWRVGRHRSPHRLSLSDDAPALVLAVPGAAADADRDLVEHIADSAAASCRGAEVLVCFLSGDDDSLADTLADLPADGHEPGQQAVVVPLLAGPHPTFDAEIATAIDQAEGSFMLAGHLGPHPLLAGALHDRLSDAGLARASRAFGLSISAGADGVLVVADRGPQAIGEAGLTAVLLAARLNVPVVPASLGDQASIDAGLERLQAAGAVRPALAPCVIGPETQPGEVEQLSRTIGIPCSAPIGDHPAVAQLVSARYGEALAQISLASH